MPNEQNPNTDARGYCCLSLAQAHEVTRLISKLYAAVPMERRETFTEEVSLAQGILEKEGWRAETPQAEDGVLWQELSVPKQPRLQLTDVQLNAFVAKFFSNGDKIEMSIFWAKLNENFPHRHIDKGQVYSYLHYYFDVTESNTNGKKCISIRKRPTYQVLTTHISGNTTVHSEGTLRECYTELEEYFKNVYDFSRDNFGNFVYPNGTFLKIDYPSTQVEYKGCNYEIVEAPEVVEEEIISLINNLKAGVELWVELRMAQQEIRYNIEEWRQDYYNYFVSKKVEVDPAEFLECLQSAYNHFGMVFVKEDENFYFISLYSVPPTEEGQDATPEQVAADSQFNSKS